MIVTYSGDRSNGDIDYVISLIQSSFLPDIYSNTNYVMQVVMKEGQALTEGEEIANDLMKKLGISDQDLVTGAYMDLILKSQY